jgi:hypothetical protein
MTPRKGDFIRWLSKLFTPSEAEADYVLHELPRDLLLLLALVTVACLIGRAIFGG